MKKTALLFSVLFATGASFCTPCETNPKLTDEAALTLVNDLIVRRSFSKDVEDVNRVVDYVHDWLKERGVFCTIETDEHGRKALWASTVPGKKADYCLSCHLDTVPGPDWMLKPQIKGDILTARGAWDCKAHSAACAMVLSRLVGTGASVGCVFNADEEVGGGCCKMMVDRGYGGTKMVMVIDGSFKVLVTAHKCQTVYKLIARGKSGHSSAPWFWENALTKLMRGCIKFEDAWMKEIGNGSAKEQWHDTIAITMAHGGTAPNNIPDYAEATVNLRGITPDADVKTLEFIKRTSGLEVIMERSTPPVVTDPNDPLMVALRQAMDAKWPKARPTRLERLNGAVDARHFVGLKVPIAIFGADGHDAHTEKERINLKTVVELIDFLVDFLQQQH